MNESPEKGEFEQVSLMTEIRLANARHSKTEDATDDDIPSTSGRQSTEVCS